MVILLDTNIILDVLLPNPEFYPLPALTNLVFSQHWILIGLILRILFNMKRADR